MKLPQSVKEFYNPTGKKIVLYMLLMIFVGMLAAHGSVLGDLVFGSLILMFALPASIYAFLITPSFALAAGFLEIILFFAVSLVVTYSIFCTLFVAYGKLNIFTNKFNFKGRVNRADFWYSFIFVSIVYSSASLLVYLSELQEVATGFLFLFLVVPLISIVVRRLRDVGRAPLWVLLFFVPWIGWSILLYFLLQKTKISLVREKITQTH